VVSELYYPEETSTGYFLTGIAEALAREFRTGVVCARPTYSSRHIKVLSRERRNGVLILRARNTRLNPHAILSRLINLFTISVVTFVTLIRVVRPRQIVIAVTNPPTLPFVVLAAARLRRARFVLLVHDVYPEVLATVGVLRRTSLVYRLLQRISAWLIRRCDHVVVLGRDMAAVIQTKMGPTNATQKISIIPNWGDVDGIRPGLSANSLRDRLGLDGKFVVQYGGNMGRTHGLDVILSAASSLRDHMDIHFLLMGWGARRGQAERHVRDSSLTNVAFHPPVPRAQLASALNTADVTVIALVEGMAGLSVPSRLYDVLAAGKPVIAIADAASELAMVVREHDLGWVIRPGDAAGFAATIVEAKRDRQRLGEMGRRARLLAETSYSPGCVGAAWVRLVRLVGA
jgi:glycosyltransferase involved in cell wall biosynthesis